MSIQIDATTIDLARHECLPFRVIQSSLDGQALREIRRPPQRKLGICSGG